MEGVKNYTINLFSKEEHPVTKNVTAEEALMVMKAVDLDKKHVIVDGEMIATHQIVSVKRDFEAERDETCDKKLTAEQRKSLDVRYLKHGNTLISEDIKKLATKKSMPAIHGSAENPELPSKNL